MNSIIARRTFLAVVPGLAGIAAAASVQPATSTAAPPPPDPFPSHDPTKVRDIVTASHGNIERVRALLKESPQLCNAAYDWGFGDWETALGAASHVGRVEIAGLLIDHGARANLFTLAMLGKLAAVKAVIDSTPGIQHIKGPHGITLLMHAQAGGESAKPVVEYLKGLGDADQRYADLPMTEEEKNRLLGDYAYGPAVEQRLTVLRQERDKQLAIRRLGGAPRPLFHQGSNAFHPAGAPDVRITFRVEGDRVLGLTITSPAPVCSAERV